VEQVYRYPQPSSVGVIDGRVGVQLSTSGGTTAAGPALHPRFFDGFLAHPEQTATALLTVPRVARTRFYVPPGMLSAILQAADPVVTSNGDRLRFESFSACCGVHARLDVLPAGMDGPPLDTGTTNVDFNPPMRAALAGIGGIDPLHVAVGAALTVTTMDTAVTEDKVPLPARWLKGFAEVQVATVDAEPAFEVPAVEARRFLRGLPRSTGSRTATFWAVPAGNGLRLTSRPGPGAVCLAGPERLQVLEPMLRFARSMRAYSAPGDSTSTARPGIWELELEDARLVVTLSPDVSRGFSGEGGVLRDLADEASADDADAVSVLLAFQTRIDVAAVARQAGISEARARRARWGGSVPPAGSGTTRSSGPTSTASCPTTPPHSRRCIHGCAMHVHSSTRGRCASMVTSPRSGAAAASTPCAGPSRAGAAPAPGTASTRTAVDRASTSWPWRWSPAQLGEPRGRRSSRRWGGPGEDRFPWPAVPAGGHEPWADSGGAPPTPPRAPRRPGRTATVREHAPGVSAHQSP